MILDTHALRNLPQLTIENLHLGRITREAVREAKKRIGPEWEDFELADELNDMLTAAKKVMI